MKAWGQIVLIFLKLFQAGYAKVRAIGRQKAQADLEGNPGRHFADHFSGGVHDDAENEAAKTRLQKRLRAD